MSFVEGELVVMCTSSPGRRRRALVEFVREILEEGAPRWMPRLDGDRDPPLPFGLLIATRNFAERGASQP
jgi:hypothetical protein